MPPHQVRIAAAEWRATVVHGDPWTPTSEERPGGEAQGFFVECRSKGLRGYLKPSRNDPPAETHPRATHEKIAADLAFDLGLPVPPAVLTDGTHCGGKERAAVISLVMYREVQKWAHAVATQSASAIAHHILRATAGMWSGMLPFDAWLSNTDRNNDSNLLIGTDTEAVPPLSEPIFCDYANSMTYARWGDGTYRDVAPPSVLPVLLQLVDWHTALDVADKISAFPVDAIREVVDRIPDEYLLPSHKEAIREGLVHRRAVVSEIIRSLSN